MRRPVPSRNSPESPPARGRSRCPIPTMLRSSSTPSAGRCGRSPANASDRAIPNLSQALHLMNGELLNRKLVQGNGRLSRMLKDPKLTDETLVRRLYLLTFGRPPDPSRDNGGPGHPRRIPQPHGRCPGPILGDAQFQGILVQSLRTSVRTNPPDSREGGLSAARFAAVSVPDHFPLAKGRCGGGVVLAGATSVFGHVFPLYFARPASALAHARSTFAHRSCEWSPP